MLKKRNPGTSRQIQKSCNRSSADQSTDRGNHNLSYPHHSYPLFTFKNCALMPICSCTCSSARSVPGTGCALTNSAISFPFATSASELRPTRILLRYAGDIPSLYFSCITVQLSLIHSHKTLFAYGFCPAVRNTNNRSCCLTASLST